MACRGAIGRLPVGRTAVVTGRPGAWPFPGTSTTGLLAGVFFTFLTAFGFLVPFPSPLAALGVRPRGFLATVAEPVPSPAGRFRYSVFGFLRRFSTSSKSK